MCCNATVSTGAQSHGKRKSCATYEWAAIGFCCWQRETPHCGQQSTAANFTRVAAGVHSGRLLISFAADTVPSSVKTSLLCSVGTLKFCSEKLCRCSLQRCRSAISDTTARSLLLLPTSRPVYIGRPNQPGERVAASGSCWRCAAIQLTIRSTCSKRLRPATEHQNGTTCLLL